MTTNFEPIDRGTPGPIHLHTDLSANLLTKENSGTVDYLSMAVAAAAVQPSPHVPDLHLVDDNKAVAPVIAKAPDLHAAGPAPAIDHGHVLPPPAPEATAAAPVSATDLHPSFWTRAANVGKALVDGAVDEVEHHPQTVKEFAIDGVESGLITSALVVGAVGLGLTAAPEVALFGGVVMAGSMVLRNGWDAYKDRATIEKNISAVADPAAHSPSDVAAARRYVENAGADGLNTVVGTVAAAGTGYGVGLAVNSGAAAAVIGRAGGQFAPFASRLQPIPDLAFFAGANSAAILPPFERAQSDYRESDSSKK